MKKWEKKLIHLKNSKELRGPHHHQGGQHWTSFLLSKLFLFRRLSTLHIFVSALAVKETQKSIKHTNVNNGRIKRTLRMHLTMSSQEGFSCQKRDLKALPWKIHVCASKPPPSSASSSRRTETSPLSWCGKSRHRCWGGVSGAVGQARGGDDTGEWVSRLELGKKVSFAYLITFHWLVVQKPKH